MIKSTLQRSSAALALGALTLGLAASCGPSVSGQDVPSDQDTSTTETATPTPKVGDKDEDAEPVAGAPDEALDKEQFEDITIENPDDVSGEGDQILIEDDFIFNYAPEDIYIPEDVKEAFPETYQTLPRYTLSYLLYSATMMDLHDSETPEETQRLAYKSLDPYLSGAMQDEVLEDLDTYFADDATEASTEDAVLRLWGVAPLDMRHDHYWEHPTTGGKAEVDHSRSWRVAIDSFDVRKVAKGKSGVDGVLVWFDRGVEIPISDEDKDMVVNQGFGILMIPSGDDGWVMDGYTFNTNTIEEVEVP